MNPTTFREAFIQASSFLKQQSIENSQGSAERLLLHLLQWDRTTFLNRWDERIPGNLLSEYDTLIQRRAVGEPMQYIVGEEHFYGLRFTVGQGVLIPRPETELLIEKVLFHAEQMGWKEDSLMLADIGTGSGAIAITLAHERPNWRVTAVDISPEALERAKRNALINGLDERIRFLQGDLIEPLEAEGLQVDILVSNPPYIPTEDIRGLQKEVKDYEPYLALDGGEDGLDYYRKIISSLPRVVRFPGIVAFEIGIHQAEDIRRELLESKSVDEVWIYPDFQGIPRVVVASRTQKE
jgi:release factor glutamine methyltransferase